MKPDYDAYLQKILSHSSFSGSVKSKELLAYLVKCLAEGKPVKEIQIAADVFQRNLSGDDLDDTIVRVSIHNLRKKLKNYYLTDGKNDHVQFIIPVGRYQIEVVDNSTRQKVGINFLHILNARYLNVLLLMVLICLGAMYFIRGKQQGNAKGQYQQTAIWNDFLDSPKKTMLVVGDYYFMTERDSVLKRTLLIRDIAINSYQDLSGFFNQHPQYAAKYAQADFTYTGYSTPFVLKELIPVLSSGEFEICLMSQFNAKYLQEYNIIFVGLFKTLGFLKSYFNYSGFKVDIDKNTVTSKASEEIFTQTGITTDFHDDYGIIAKFPGPKNNTIMLFNSFHDIGVVECVKHLTNYPMLQNITKELKTRFGTIPQGFEILIKAEGVNRNDMTSKIITINPLGSILVFSGGNK